jgi:hypothetical protein
MSIFDDDLPPTPYLRQILRIFPRAVLLYIDLWKLRNQENIVMVERASLRLDFLTSLPKFRNDLMCLVKEGLANVEETKSFFIVELVDWEIDAEGMTLS